MQKYSVVSMFSGCGGMDLGLIGGFEYLGKRFKGNPFDIKWANDLNPYACATYEHNLQHKIHVGSVWDHIDTMPATCDLLIGGFPCQDISINGKRRGIAGERSGLYRAMVEAVRRMRPKMFVAENVRGLLYAYNRESLETVISDFSALGYKVTYKLYLTADYGVPQSRERVLIVGVQDDVAPFVEPEAATPKGSWITSRTAIQDLEDTPLDQTHSHVWSLAKRSSDQGGRVLNPDKPSPTIRAECHGNNSFHYTLPRRISMREAARFQSFPDDFIFQARLRETERMIGNAVPPVFAWHMAQSIKATLEAFDVSESKVLVAAE